MTGPGKGGDRRAWGAAHDLVCAWGSNMIDELLKLAEVSKAARRGVAAAIEEAPEPQRTHVRTELASRGDGDPSIDTERLLRRARGADVLAQVRRNPIHRNEGFLCTECGQSVPPAPGGGVRNHCPYCLSSQHVDGPVPGDRASNCGGAMIPIALDTTSDLWVLQRCLRCGHERRNRLHPHWEVAPDLVDNALIKPVST
jgi:hypothetical protein